MMTVLYEQECCSCFMTFAVPKSFDKARRADGKSFFCPNGHSQSYTESEIDKLRRETERMKQDRAYMQDRIDAERAEKEHAQRQAAARKGVITKIRKRVGAGVCPCCTRHFDNLQNHMANKHPQYATEEVA